MQYIHLLWSGPYTLKDFKSLKDDNKHYGVYQVYGHHHLYGQNVLLYIGKADQQTFGERISREEWSFTYDPENVQVYIGQIADKNKITEAKWSKVIDVAERLLIYAHNPVYNTSNTNSIPFELVGDYHIHNWNRHRDLFPEVSGIHYTDFFNNVTEVDILSME